MNAVFKPKLDPYGSLEYAVGSADDFVCFDVDFDYERGEAHIASTLNSETGSFVEAFRPTVVVKFGAAKQAAQELVGAALDWCCDNDVEHDEEWWNQDPEYFVRDIVSMIEGTARPARIVKVAS